MGRPEVAMLFIKHESFNNYKKAIKNKKIMEPKPMIRGAFLDAKRTIPQLKNSNYEMLDHGCTINVAHMCLHLNSTYGFSLASLYNEMLDLFCASSDLELSGLIDLTSYETFTESLNSIETKARVLSGTISFLNQIGYAHGNK